MADQGNEGLLSPFLRLQRINKSKPFLRGNILDYGCGAGLLAPLVLPENYIGYDTDESVIKKAQKDYPNYRFQANSVTPRHNFDTVISLAVIEHVLNPIMFLKELTGYLKINSLSRIILTTPHPSIEKIHIMGAKIGIFSQHASEEHQTLLDRNKIIEISNQTDLKLIRYDRFLLGANQLIVLGFHEG